MGKKSRSKRIGRDKNTGIKYSTIGLPKVLEIRKQKALIDSGNHPIFNTWQDLMYVVAKETAKIRPSTAVLDMNYVEMTSLDRLVNRNYESIFINSYEVADFLESNTINSKDINSMVSVIEDYIDISVSKPYEVFCIHLPGRKYSLIVSITSTDITNSYIKRKGLNIHKDSIEIGNKLFIGYIRNDGNGDEDTGYSILDSDILEVSNSHNIPVRTNWRIILNTFLYMSAFPECVKEGVPNIYLDDEERKVKSKTVSISDAMKEAYSHGPISPHMRRGHFRFLKSDKYKGKRFQTVYVKPTMVKGHAITIS
jgi:hypothetical protein